ASRYPTFPILLETTRECVRDVFDLPALKEVLRDIQSRKVRVVSVETKHASPFAQSLLFGWIAVYMYEGDSPPAERRAAAPALDVSLPMGLPAAFTEPVDDPLTDLVARYARTHGPFHTEDIAHRFGIAAGRVLPSLERLESHERIVRGEFRPEGSEREWCDTNVLKLLRRRSLARLRKEIEAVDGTVLGRFLPAWHG